MIGHNKRFTIGARTPCWSERVRNAGCSWHGLRASFWYSQHAPNMARFTKQHETAYSSCTDEQEQASYTRDSQDNTSRPRQLLKHLTGRSRRAPTAHIATVLRIWRQIHLLHEIRGILLVATWLRQCTKFLLFPLFFIFSYYFDDQIRRPSVNQEHNIRLANLIKLVSSFWEPSKMVWLSREVERKQKKELWTFSIHSLGKNLGRGKSFTVPSKSIDWALKVDLFSEA